MNELDYKLPAFFIVSYKRSDNVKTLRFLKKVNYPMDKVHIVIDDEEPSANDYKKLCDSNGCVLDIFNIADERMKYDFVMRKNKARRTAGLARNAIYDIADRYGILKWVVSDDDTNSYIRKFNDTKSTRVTEIEFKTMVIETLDFMERHRIGCFGWCQGGDFIGGINARHSIIRYKIMNTTFVLSDLCYRPERG